MTAGYSLFVDLFRDYFAWRPEEEEAARAERLARCLREFQERGDLSAEQVEELGPLLGNLLSLRFGNDWDDRLKHAGPEQIRHRTLVAVREFWEALARRQPVVLLCEDLHWADRLSLDLIALLMETLPRAPLLLLCVFRPEREHPCARLATLAPQKCGERYTELRLRELSPEQSRGLIQSLLARETLPGDVEASILEKARGNPFFLEEVVYSLIQGGVPARNLVSRETAQPGERVEAGPSTGGERSLAVPASVQTLILSRVDRLEEGLKRVLQVASVVGRLFRRRLLEQLDVPALEAALWELEEQGLIYQERVVPEPEYSFRHVLTQETIYGSLLRRQRQALHQRVGEVLEALHPEPREEYYEQLAYHYERGGADEKAVDYLLKAGEKARRTYLNEAAIGYFQRALERLEGTARGEAHQDWQLEALKGLGQIYHGIGNEAEAEGCFRQAIRLGREIGLAPRALVRLYFWLGDVLHWQGRDQELTPIAEEGLALLGEDTECVEAALMNFQLDQHRRNAQAVERLSYCEELRVVYVGLAMICVHEDKNVADGIRWLQALARRAEQHYDLRALGQVHYYMAHFLARQGDLLGSLAESQRGLDLLTKIGDDKHGRWPLASMSEIFLSLGDLAKAEEYGQRSCELGERVGNPRDIGESHRMKGVLALSRGCLDEAATSLQKGAELLRGIGPLSFVQGTLLLGQTYLALGNPREALKQFQDFLPMAQIDASAFAACLSGLEDAFDNPEAFRAYCRGFREEHSDVNDSPVVQWYLEPTEPCASSQRWFYDDFATPLGIDWVWHDPFGDCSFKIQDGLEIDAANARDLWHVNLSAPRLLRSVSGDFAVQAVACSIEGKPAIGGLLLWKDRENFLRLDRGTRGTQEISFMGHVGNNEVIGGRGHLPGERVFLRLERLGNRVRALCSADGQAWFTVGQVDFPSKGPAQMGLHAIGAIDRTIYPGAYPEGTAIRFEGFQLWR